MIEIPGLRTRCGTQPPGRAFPAARRRAFAAALALAIAPLPSLAVVSPPAPPPAATPVPAVAPAPASAPTPPAAPRVRAKNAPLVAISTPPPEFPERARRMRISGYVVVTYTIGTDGRVGNVRIVESQPRGVFEREVESTLARWRYEPLAAPREITHTFDFDQ